MPRQRGVLATVCQGASGHGCNKVFKKTMKKTSFRTLTAVEEYDLTSYSYFPPLGIPSWFVEQYANEFETVVGVAYEGGPLLWNINITISRINNKPHAAFGKGWNEFAEFYSVRQGDQLKFSLIGQSHFIVEHIDANLSSSKSDESRIPSVTNEDGPLQLDLCNCCTNKTIAISFEGKGMESNGCKFSLF